jgi:putative spermidine/putrescine transport system permease protein
MTGLRRRLPSVPQAIAALTLAFLVLPFIVVMGASLDDSSAYRINFPPTRLSLGTYLEIPPSYLRGLGTSLMVASGVAVMATGIGLMAALGIVRGRLIGREVIQSFFRLPVQIPLVVTGAVFLQFYYLVAGLTGWNAMRGISGLMIAHVFVAVPYVVGSISVVLARMDPALDEAAASLGATPWATFRQVTLPLLRPGMLAGLLYSFIVSFGDVPIAVFLVGADISTLPVQIFQDMQFDFKPSMLAISALIVVFSLAAILVAQKIAGLEFVLPSGRKAGRTGT